MRRLKKWVKVILTIIIVGISATMYIKSGRLGELAQSSQFYRALTISTWAWLIFGQMISLYLIWED